MPTYLITHPSSGKKLKISGDTYPSKDVLDSIFSVTYKPTLTPQQKEEDLMHKATSTAYQREPELKSTIIGNMTERAKNIFAPIPESRPGAGGYERGLDVAQHIAATPARALAVPGGAIGDVVSTGMTMGDLALGNVPSKLAQKAAAPIAARIPEGVKRIVAEKYGQVSGDVSGKAALESLGLVGLPGGSVIAGKTMTGLGKASEKVFTKLGTERAAKSMVPTTSEEAMSVISKSTVPKQQVKDATNLLSKYGLQGKLHDPNNVLQSKALDMAYVRAQAAKEKIIKGAMEGDKVNPIAAVDDKMIKFINTEIKSGKRDQAEKIYQKLKDRLTKDGYNSELPLTNVANLKEDLVVNWKRGVEHDPLEAISTQIEKKMYHQLNDIIKEKVPSAYKDAHEASELFSVADMARNAIKPKMSLLPTTLGGTTGALIGGGKAVSEIAQSIGSQIPAHFATGDVLVPAAIAGIAGLGVQQLSKPSTLGKMASLSRGVQDIGTRLQFKKPALRPGSRAYEKGLEKSVNPENKMFFEYDNYKRLKTAAANSRDVQKAEVFRKAMNETVDKIQNQVFKEGTPSQIRQFREVRLKYGSGDTDAMEKWISGYLGGDSGKDIVKKVPARPKTKRSK